MRACIQAADGQDEALRSFPAAKGEVRRNRRRPSCGGKGMRPLAIDLYCGLGGWSDGLLHEGWDVIGFDIQQHVYGEHRYPAQLVIQDVLTLHGSQFKDARLIVASPPCQFFSYCAMPWTRAKRLAAEGRADPARLEKELALFATCFRIQREASEAAGRHIPMVVENVKGAQPWVGRARGMFGSFALWGDVPALMPIAARARKFNPDRIGHATKNNGGSWFGVAHGESIIANNPVSVPADGLKVPGFRFDGRGKSFQGALVDQARRDPMWERGFTATASDRLVAEGRKGAGAGVEWFDGNLC